MPNVALLPFPFLLCSLTLFLNLVVVFSLKVILPLSSLALSGLFFLLPFFWSFLGAGVLLGSFFPGLSAIAFNASKYLLVFLLLFSFII